MSAYMCADDTFDYLAGLMRKGHTTRQGGFTFHLRGEEASDLGVRTDRLTGITDTDILIAILRRENARSLIARYGETAAGDAAGTYTPAYVPPAQVDPVVALASLACLEYQSCEHEAYATSTAKHLLEALRAHAIRLLPGYDAAPWGWTRADVAVAS